MRKIKHFICVIGVLCFVSLCSNCAKIRTGVCTGYSAEFNSTYCKDGWTKEECDDWDTQEINGVNWFFHQGQTCEERGTPATP